MKKYSITINGVTYVAEVEELSEGAAPAAVAAAPAAAAPAPKPAAKPAAPAGGTPVKSPMPGTISKILVSTGQSVKKGDVLAVLEAMKMENDIPSPRDGTVAAVAVQAGASVQTDDVIVTLQ